MFGVGFWKRRLAQFDSIIGFARMMPDRTTIILGRSLVSFLGVDIQISHLNLKLDIGRHQWSIDRQNISIGSESSPEDVGRS